MLGTLQPCQLLWPPKAVVLPKRLQTSQWTPLSPPCHYFQWGILGGEPLATVSILNIHSIYNHKFLALLTSGFATKSPQSVNALPFFHHQILSWIFFFFFFLNFYRRLSTSENDRPRHVDTASSQLSKVFLFWLLPALPLC